MAAPIDIERLAELVEQFEALADMEGWDHFFTHDHYLRNLDELRAGLLVIGDETSLSVIDDYKQRMVDHGIPLEADAIVSFLAAQDDAYFANDRNWQTEFADLYEQRRARLDAYRT